MARGEDAVFRALAHPVRRKIIEILIHDYALASGEVAKHFKSLSWMAVSKHLNVLLEAGILDRLRSEMGQTSVYTVNATRLEVAHEWFRALPKKQR